MRWGTQKKCVQGVGPGGGGGGRGGGEWLFVQCEGAPLINAWLKTAISFHPLWYIKGCRLVRSGLMNIRADIGPLGGWGARRPPAAHTCTCSVIKSAGPTLCHAIILCAEPLRLSVWDFECGNEDVHRGRRPRMHWASAHTIIIAKSAPSCFLAFWLVGCVSCCCGFSFWRGLSVNVFRAKPFELTSVLNFPMALETFRSPFASSRSCSLCFTRYLCVLQVLLKAISN